MWSLSVWGPGPPLCASAHQTLVSAQEVATDIITRSCDCSKSHSEEVTGQGQEPSQGTRDLTHNYCMLLGLGAGSGEGGWEFPSRSFLEWLSPGAPDSGSPAFLSAPRDQKMRSKTPPPLLLPLLLLLPALEPRVRGCPSGCQCNQPQTVFCTARQGTTVPLDVPPDTVGLYT